MKLLFLGHHFAPEDVSGAALATELFTDLISRGHQVTFITSAPSYPKGIVFPGYKNHWLFIEDLAGSKVIRIWSYISSKKTFWRQIINFGTFSFSAFWGGLLSGKPDLIISFSPPLPLGFSAWVLSALNQVPWLLRVEDLYPDTAVASGIIRNTFVIRLLYALEKFLYKNATHISVISEGFKSILVSKGVPGKKVTVIPVWADSQTIVPLPKENAFRTRNHINGKFVLLYAGNIGQTSSLEDVLYAAEILKRYPDIHFIIVGEGIRKNALIELAHKLELSNMTFLPYQDRLEYPTMLAAADVGLVTINKESSKFSLPSKTFNIMAGARPILVISPLNSELANLVQQVNCGMNVPQGNPEDLAECIINLKNSPDRLIQMGKNARICLEEHFSRKIVVSQNEDLYYSVKKKNNSNASMH